MVIITMLGFTPWLLKSSAKIFILWLLTLAEIAWCLAITWGYDSPGRYAICTVVSHIIATIIAMIILAIGASLLGAGFVALLVS